MEISSVRSVAYIVVICGCFIYLYPKLFHPMVKSVLGIGDKEEAKKRDGFGDNMPDRPPFHPAGGRPNDGGMPEHVRQHMRPGPHPGMRAAAEMNSRQTKASSGRGMMGVILPMYAVGIIVYLVYTLFKVFNKKDPKSDDRENMRKNMGEGSLSHDPQYYRDNSEAEDDMRQLQARLAETEAQMTKILQAMRNVQSRVDQTGQELGTGDPHSTGKKVNEGESSAESSPDSDSFEIVSKSDRESSGDDSSPVKVETVKSVAEEVVESIDKGSNPAEDECEEDEEEGDNKEAEEEVDVVLDDLKKDEEETESSVRRRITKSDETEES